jgi:hypothetical protein
MPVISFFSRGSQVHKEILFLCGLCAFREKYSLHELRVLFSAQGIGAEIECRFIHAHGVVRSKL